jgi:hypothetical protein
MPRVEKIANASPVDDLFKLFPGQGLLVEITGRKLNLLVLQETSCFATSVSGGLPVKVDHEMPSVCERIFKASRMGWRSGRRRSMYPFTSG